MPKIPPRDNRRNRSARTIQGTAQGIGQGMGGLLQRISQRAEVAVSTEGAPGALSHIDVIRAALPAALRAHVTACLLRPGEWVLFADAAVWATRLRMAACEVMAQGGFAGLTSGSPPPRITVRVAASGRNR